MSSGIGTFFLLSYVGEVYPAALKSLGGPLDCWFKWLVNASIKLKFLLTGSICFESLAFLREPNEHDWSSKLQSVTWFCKRGCNYFLLFVVFVNGCRICHNTYWMTQNDTTHASSILWFRCIISSTSWTFRAMCHRKRPTPKQSVQLAKVSLNAELQHGFPNRNTK